MPMRVSGLMSGLDTDAMVQDLVTVANTKVESIKKEQTKLGWKQEAWKTLNTKINSFFKNQLGNLRYEGSFNKKATTVSNPSIASVVAGDSAVNGTQSLSVQSLAKAGYLTGGKLTGDVDGAAVTGKTTLAKLGIADGSSINVEVAGKTKTLNFNGSTTIDQVVSSLKSAGVEASFDNTNKRLFVNVKNSGAANDFELTAANTNGQTFLSKLKLVDSSEADIYKGVVSGSAEYNTLLATEKATLTTSYNNQLTDAQSTVSTLNNTLTSLNNDLTDKITDLNTKYSGGSSFTLTDLDDASTVDNALTDVQTAIDARVAFLQSEGKTEEEIAADADLIQLNEEKTDVQSVKDAYTQIATTQSTIDTTNANITTYQNKINDVAGVLTAEATTILDNKITAANNGTYADTNAATKSVRVYGSDAQITLNGATFTSANNSFTVNGLTITALETTGTNDDGSAKQVSISTGQDVEGIYKMVKDFFKEYNSLVNEMSKLYNADAAKGYNPLTDEEKDAMTESEVELWEKKIKDSLLRKDANLNTVMNMLQGGMLSMNTVSGVKYNLASFGIETQSYFEAEENERGAYHINGDSEDSVSSGNTDKLKTAIATNPTAVTKFFSNLANELYDNLNKEMKSSANRSIYNAYDNKKLQEEYDDYTSKIAKQQAKVDAMEERYYAQFTAMEKAMANMQSSSNALTSMLGQ